MSKVINTLTVKDCEDGAEALFKSHHEIDQDKPNLVLMAMNAGRSAGLLVLAAAKIKELEERLKNISEDTERLDWLEKVPAKTCLGLAPSGTWRLFDETMKDKAIEDTVRKAIDIGRHMDLVMKHYNT